MVGERAHRSSRDRRSASILSDIGALLQDLSRRIFDPYRPELHYMRGPGPKWHAKHRPGTEPAPVFQALPALARVRVKS